MKWWGWGDRNKTFNTDNRPGFMPFLKSVLGETQLEPIAIPTLEKIVLPTPRIKQACLEALQSVLKREQIATDKESRLSHCYGKSYRDLIRTLKNNIANAPDVVLFPSCHDDIVNIMKVANEHQVIVIPFGGGTNIVGCLDVLPDETNMVLSVDMRSMNRILSIDADSMLAEIEAGALGKALEEQLNAQGFTLGHFPDSFEYSSLGGWVVTRSAGMQSDYYGNIENMLMAVTFVTPQGEIKTQAIPRASVGPNMNEIILGCEGIFGILTKVVVRISTIEKQTLNTLLFPSFEAAILTLRQATANHNRPTMMRISDPQETQFSFAMSPKTGKIGKAIKKVYFKYIKHVKKIDLSKACISIVGFLESDQKQYQAFFRLAKKNGAAILGKKPAKAWAASKYDYPYIRDYLLGYSLVVDVSETAVSWAHLLPHYYAVADSMKDFYRDKCQGQGYIGCHLSHSYKTGACLYFTFCFSPNGQDHLNLYLEAKKRMVEAILDNQGSLSHHHAIGVEHLPWVEKYLNTTTINLLKGLKQQLDPNNICNPGKLIPEDKQIEFYWP